MFRLLLGICFATPAFAVSPPEISVDLKSEMILVFQNTDGGWPKNVAWEQFNTLADAVEWFQSNRKRKSTIDNSATYVQIRDLAKAYDKTNNPAYRDAARRGLEFLLREQRPSGGWRGSDVDAITFNDNAMVGVMQLLKEITNRKNDCDWIEPATLKRCQQALAKAVRVVLDCQIVVGGKKTAWCQQHDHKSLKPVKARTYELPSISGGESVKIVRYLMGIEQPNSEIVTAIESAVAWFRKSVIHGVRIERFEIDPVKEGSKVIKQDVRMVRDPAAKPVWARFYEVETNRPFFCNRDGIKVYSLAEVRLERRTGYSWYGDAPAKLLETDYPMWRERLQKNERSVPK